MMKKMLALALVLLLALAFGGACADEKQVLTVVTWDANAIPYIIEAQEAAFEAKYPDVDLKYIDVASLQYTYEGDDLLDEGYTFDVIMIKEARDILNWQADGYAEPLDEYIARDGYDLSGFVGMETNYAMDGVQYALPFRSDFWVLFYNKDLFDAAGVAYPTNDMTWDQYAALAKQMTTDEVYGTHYHTWLSAVANWSVCDGVNTLADREYSDLAYFYNLYQDLEDSGACMSYHELRESGLHYSWAFAEGNIAMMPMGYWYAANLIGLNNDGACDFNWGITAVPHADNVPAGSSFGNLTGVMINKKSGQKDLAWQYVSWLCGEEGAAATASTGSRPAWVSESVAEELAAVEGFPDDEASRAALLPSSVSMEWPAVDRQPEIQSAVEGVHELIMSRGISVEDGIKEMNERVAGLFE